MGLLSMFMASLFASKILTPDAPKFDNSAAEAAAAAAAEARKKKLKTKRMGNASLLTGAGNESIVGGAATMLGGG